MPNHRTNRGRFASGNAGGPGNPHAKQVARFRSLLLDSVTEQDFEAVVAELVNRAKAGEGWAIKELLDRTAGKPRPVEDLPDDGPVQIRVVHVEAENKLTG